MWINISRKQNQRSIQMPTAAHSAASHPGPPSRPERRKSNENKKTDKEKLNNQTDRKENTEPRPASSRPPEEIAGNYGSSPVVARTAWGSPTRQPHERAANKSEKRILNRDAPTRKSFRLCGLSTNLNNEKNMLPLWLEEKSGDESSGQILESNRNEKPASDVSFDSRWESLNCRNRNQTSVSTDRPPGWEDVDHHGRPKRNKSVRKSPSFCPSFTINDIPQCNLKPTAPAEIRPISPPPTIIIDTPLVEKVGPANNNSHDAFNMAELSANVDTIFDDSFVHDKAQCSMSNLAPQSASNSPARTPSQSSTIGITDRHLWASSDSFICEDFSFCKAIPIKKQQEEKISKHSSPRSLSQVLLNTQEISERQISSHDGEHEYSEIPLNGESSYEQASEQEYSEIEGTSYSDLHTSNYNEGELYLGAAYHLGNEGTVEGYNFPEAFHGIPHQEQTCQEMCCPTVKVKNDSFRDKWIRFDHESFDNSVGSSSGIDFDSTENGISKNDSIDLVHQSNFATFDNDKNKAESPTSPTSPVLYRNISGSTLNLVEPRLQQAPEIYTGHLVRQYSIRGRRASKRVTRSVSQKMKPAEYGKLTEPVAPMYSKAALSMVSGPGLFEQNDPIPSLGKVVDDEENAQIDQTKEKYLELPAMTTDSNVDHMKKSTISPGLPSRAGSLRVPRLPTLFLRRSLSLNTPKVSRGEVPFHRLPERRGSFKRAFSGIGAIARSFRRRPEDRVQTDELSSQITEKAASHVQTSRLQRSGSVSFRQTPKAPRLPRRAISHKHSSANEAT